MDVISSTILILILFLILIGTLEIYFHRKALENIPIRIHVNGTRGKSSVTRLIASGLRESGFNTYAKTTGTTPRIINNHGKDVEIHRLRSASIGEQIKLLRYFSKKSPDAVVMECMAVNPQYQWVSEHRIVRSTVSVMTNVRPDHLDEMGTTNEEIAYSLSNTIPYNSVCITSENETLEPLRKVAKKRNSKLLQSEKSEITLKYLNEFPFIEHPENLSLALEVCKHLGANKDDVLNGMKKTVPDPGALFIWNLRHNGNLCNFISGFAANDPHSTKMVWNLVKKRFSGDSCIFLNTRDDRRYRTIQLIDLVLKDIKPDVLILRADNVDKILSKYNSNVKIIKFSMNDSPTTVVNKIIKMNNFFILGIGNIVGWGEEFIDKLKVYV